MTRIVMYLMDGHHRATRHAPGCGVLRRAEATLEGRVHARRGENLEIWDEENYPNRLGGGPVPHDHTCVAKAAFATPSLSFEEA